MLESDEPPIHHVCQSQSATARGRPFVVRAATWAAFCSASSARPAEQRRLPAPCSSDCAVRMALQSILTVFSRVLLSPVHIMTNPNRGRGAYVNGRGGHPVNGASHAPAGDAAPDSPQQNRTPQVPPRGTANGMHPRGGYVPRGGFFRGRGGFAPMPRGVRGRGRGYAAPLQS